MHHRYYAGEHLGVRTATSAGLRCFVEREVNTIFPLWQVFHENAAEPGVHRF